MSDTLLSSPPQTQTTDTQLADPTGANTGIVVLLTSVDTVVLAIPSVAAVVVVVRAAAAVTVVVVVVLVDILCFFYCCFMSFIWCCCVCVFGCIDARGLVAVAAKMAIVAGVLVKEGSVAAVAVVILAVAVMVVDLIKIYNL